MASDDKRADRKKSMATLVTFNAGRRSCREVQQSTAQTEAQILNRRSLSESVAGPSDRERADSQVRRMRAMRQREACQDCAERRAQILQDRTPSAIPLSNLTSWRKESP